MATALPTMTPPIQRLRDSISGVFLGNPSAVEQVICCLLAKGHVLIEDVPGVGKTVLATALARSVDCSFSRIQLTPDLLPSDIIGVSLFRAESGATGVNGNGLKGGFEFKKGPLFANIVLADEINRTPPRTQTALLEAMSEATVTVDGKSHPLDQPFMLIATQNPFDFEGTYPLPENQLDRFFMRISLGYPSPEVEARVLAPPTTPCTPSSPSSTPRMSSSSSSRSTASAWSRRSSSTSSPSPTRPARATICRSASPRAAPSPSPRPPAPPPSSAPATTSSPRTSSTTSSPSAPTA
jgi:hypothetical protein